MAINLSDFFSQVDFFYSDDFLSLPRSGKIARIGQMLARQFLLNKGKEILSENYYTNPGEIDIVARDKSGRLYFVEVKTRTSEYKGKIEESVHLYKQQSLLKSAYAYLYQKGWLGEVSFQIDVIFIKIDLQTQTAKIKYLPNVIEDKY